MTQISIDATEFDRAADALTADGFDHVAGAVVQVTLKQAGEAVRGRVRNRARRHRRSGRLEMGVQSVPAGHGMETVVRVHARGGIAAIIAGGAKPHDIHAVRALALPLVGLANAAGPVSFAAVVHHPGVTGDRFFHAGVQDSAGDIQALVDTGAERMATELAQRVEGKQP